MTYNDAYMRFYLLGDALALGLSAKAMAETLRLRAHYGKAVDEFAKAREQIEKDAAPVEGKERTEEQAKAVTDAIEAKAAEECGIADRRYSPEAFEGVTEAALAAGDVRTMLVMRIAKSDDGAERQEPAKIPAISWLEMVANNLAD